MPKFLTVEDEIAHNVRRMKLPLFGTRKSIDEVIKESGLKGEAVVALMVAINTMLEQIATEIQNGNLTSK